MTHKKEDESVIYHKCLVLIMQQLGIVEMMILPETMQKMIDVKPEDQVCAIIDHTDEGVLVRVSTVEHAKEYKRIFTGA